MAVANPTNSDDAPSILTYEPSGHMYTYSLLDGSLVPYVPPYGDSHPIPLNGKIIASSTYDDTYLFIATDKNIYALPSVYRNYPAYWKYQVELRYLYLPLTFHFAAGISLNNVLSFSYGDGGSGRLREATSSQKTNNNNNNNNNNQKLISNDGLLAAFVMLNPLGLLEIKDNVQESGSWEVFEVDISCADPPQYVDITESNYLDFSGESPFYSNDQLIITSNDHIPGTFIYVPQGGDVQCIELDSYGGRSYVRAMNSELFRFLTPTTGPSRIDVFSYGGKWPKIHSHVLSSSSLRIVSVVIDWSSIANNEGSRTSYREYLPFNAFICGLEDGSILRLYWDTNTKTIIEPNVKPKISSQKSGFPAYVISTFASGANDNYVSPLYAVQAVIADNTISRLVSDCS